MIEILKRMLIIGTLFLIFTHDAFSHSHTDQDYSEPDRNPNGFIEWIIEFFNDNHNSSSLEDYRLRYDCYDDIDLDIADSDFPQFYLALSKSSTIAFRCIAAEFHVINFSNKNISIVRSIYGRAPPAFNSTLWV